MPLAFLHCSEALVRAVSGHVAWLVADVTIPEERPTFSRPDAIFATLALALRLAAIVALALSFRLAAATFWRPAPFAFGDC